MTFVSSPPATPPPKDDVSSVVAPAGEDLSPLWARWRDEHDEIARNELITLHHPYARMVAATLFSRRLHDEVQFDDYLQLACVGLIEAVDRYDPSYGAQFKTFASKRVQGAVLNGLVRLTEKNHQISIKVRLRRERMESIKEKSTTTVPDNEAANEAGGPALLFRYLAEVGIGVALGVLLEGTGMMDHDAFESEARAPSPEVSYFRKNELEQLRNVLVGLVHQLPEQQKAVIQQHYLQEIPFERIASVMGVTRGRISQLHRLGLLRLRDLLANNACCDVSL